MMRKTYQVLTTLGLLMSVCLPVKADEILLRKVSGVYQVPLKINNILTKNFILDTGAAEVVIPEDVAITLIRSGTIDQNDFLARQTYTLANGAQVTHPRIILKSLQLGNHTVHNVPAVITNANGSLLLGQNFLDQLGTWSLDNRRQIFSFNPTGVATGPKPLPRPRLEPSSPDQQPTARPTTANQFSIASIHLQEGLKRHQDGDIRGSVNAFTKAIRTYPTATAYVYRSAARTNLKDYQGAIADANQAIRLDPDFSRGYVNRASARIGLGDYHEAIKDANLALRADPNDGYAYTNRGIAHSHIKNYQAALRDYQRSSSLFSQQGNITMHQTVVKLMEQLQ